MTPSDLQKTFAHIPRLQTPRLILRAMHTRDAADMYDYAKTEQATRYLSWRPHSNLSMTKSYLATVKSRYRKGTLFDWAIEERATGRMIGTCGFVGFDTQNQSAEIGYVLHPAFWGQGLMPEAVGAVLTFAFEVLGLNRITAQYMVANAQSRRVMEKVGMSFEGIQRQSLLRDGIFEDLGKCAILRSDYFANAERNFR